MPAEPTDGGGTSTAQDVELAGRAYVLVSREEFDRLRRQSQAAPAFTSLLASESIGPELRARRRRARLTLRQVADRAGIRVETLCRIEKSRTSPSARTLQAVVRALEARA